jgi:hypothetical protein
MRILVSCLQSCRDHHIPAYGFWRRYFLRGLQEAGHAALEVPGIDWAEGLTYSRGPQLAAWRARTWETTLAYVRHETARRPIDLFLGYLFPAQVDVGAIEELQRLGIPCVNFFCDGVREFRKAPVEFRPFTLHWVPDYEALPIYREAGLPHMQAPYPCWVAPEFRRVPAAETEQPTFIGSSDILRRELFGRAIKLGAQIVLRGPGWRQSPVDGATAQHSHHLTRILANQLALARNTGLRSLYFKALDRLRPISAPVIPDAAVKDAVSDAEYFRISREAVVTIGVNRVPTAKASHRKPLLFSRLRDVEAPMLGACYLTEQTESVERMYDAGTEVETYRTPEELIGKLDELTASPERRRNMRERAQRRALQDYSLGRTIARLTARLGLPVATTAAISA